MSLPRACPRPWAQEEAYEQRGRVRGNPSPRRFRQGLSGPGGSRHPLFHGSFRIYVFCSGSRAAAPRSHLNLAHFSDLPVASASGLVFLTTKQPPKGLILLRLSRFFGELFLPAFRYGLHLALLAFDEFVFNKQVPSGIRTLGSFGDPVVDTLFFDLKASWLGQGVVGPQDLQSFAPRITCFFRNDKAVLGLLGFPDTG